MITCLSSFSATAKGEPAGKKSSHVGWVTSPAHPARSASVHKSEATVTPPQAERRVDRPPDRSWLFRSTPGVRGNDQKSGGAPSRGRHYAGCGGR
jgi:hypothetical protein